MRRLLPLLFLFAIVWTVQAVHRPITVKDITFMLHGGCPVEMIMRELSSRPFAEKIDSANEALLVQAGASAELIEVLKSGRKPTAAQLPPPLPTLPYVNETQWVTDQILRDIAEIVSFAKSGETFDPASLKLTIERGVPDPPAFRAKVESPVPVEAALALKHHLWAPENYSPWVTALLHGWNVPQKPKSSPSDVSLPDVLTERDFAVLIRQSKRISDALTKSPLDPELNEDAAFILGCFGLREAAGAFSDVRSTLSRISTHLAIARSLQPAEGETGKLARLIQLTLIGRQKEALEGVATLPSKQARWASALTLRITGDWRSLEKPAKASSLEQAETFRAMREAGLQRRATMFLRDVHAQLSADWMRIAMENSMSIQEGHVFAAQGFTIELASLAEDWQTFSANSLRPSDLNEVINRPATRGIARTIDGRTQLEVLSWGDIAAFHQRHLCHGVTSCHKFLRDRLGMPEEAREFQGEVEKTFSGLTLYPLLKGRMQAKKGNPATDAVEANKLWREHPELFTSAVRASITEVFNRVGPNVTLDSWFFPPMPFGTVYDLPDRVRDCWNPDLSGKKPPFWEELRALAPYHPKAIKMVTWSKFQSQPSAEQVVADNASIQDFNIHAMWDIADRAKDQPELYRKTMEKICELEPDYFMNLGEYYMERSMFAEAAAALQKGFDLATDRVHVSNNCKWLVGYYFDNGRKEEAMKIAKDAAEAYSSRGLATMAFLLERMDRLAEAEDYYKKIKERYSDASDLDAFYLRNRKRDPKYERFAANKTTALFPQGVEKVALSDLAGRPADGVMIASSSEKVVENNLKAGDVIVAIDGTRVHSENQYLYLRGLEQVPQMTLIVWNGTQYAERKLVLRNRRLLCDLSDFKGQ